MVAPATAPLCRASRRRTRPEGRVPATARRLLVGFERDVEETTRASDLRRIVLDVRPDGVHLVAPTEAHEWDLLVDERLQLVPRRQTCGLGGAGSELRHQLLLLRGVPPSREVATHEHHR